MSQLNVSEQDLDTDFVGNVLKQYNLPSPSYFVHPLSKSLPLPSTASSSGGKPGGISSLKKLKAQAELGDKKLRSSKQRESPPPPPRSTQDEKSQSGGIKRKTATDLFLESIQLENEKLERELQRLTIRSTWEDDKDGIEKAETDTADDHPVIQDAEKNAESDSLSSPDRHTREGPVLTATISVETPDDTETTHTKMKTGRFSSADFLSTPLSPSSSSSSSSSSASRSHYIVTNTAEESTYVAEPKFTWSSPSPRDNENQEERNRWQRFSIPDGGSPPNRKNRTVPESNNQSKSNSNLVRTLMGDWSLNDPTDERDESEDEKGSSPLVENDPAVPAESGLFIAANKRSPSVVSASSSSLLQIHSNNNITTIIGRQRAAVGADAMLCAATDAANSPPTWHHNDPTADPLRESIGNSSSSSRWNQDEMANHKSEKNEYILPTNDNISKANDSNETDQWDDVEQNITTNGKVADCTLPSDKTRPKSAPAIGSKTSNHTKNPKEKENMKKKEKPTVKSGGKNHFLLEQKLLKERERHVQLIHDERKKESMQKERYEHEICQLTEKLVRYELRLKGVHNSLRSQQIQLKEKDETIQHLNQEIAKKNKLLESSHTSVGSDGLGSHRGSALNPLPLAARKKESLLESKISTLEQTVEKYKKQIYRSQEITHSLLNKLREIQHEEDEAVASRFKLQRTVETCSLKLKHCGSENKMLKRELELLKSNEERWRVNYEKLENRYKTVVAESIEFEAKTGNLYNVTQQLQQFILNEINLSS